MNSFLVAVILAQTAGARGIRSDAARDEGNVRTRSQAGSSAAPCALGDPPLFSFASPTATCGYAAYAGLPAASTLCDALNAGDKVGNWWCLNGDGTMASGSVQTLSSVGSPTTQSLSVCPNGPACGAVTRSVYGTGNGHEGGTIAAPTGAWSVCQVISLRNSTFENTLSFAETGSSIAFLIQSNASSPDLTVYTNGTPRRVLSLTAGAWHVVCATSNTAQTSGQAYLDGTAIGAAYSPALGSFGSQTWRVSGYGNSTSPLLRQSQVRGTFMVESELSAGRIAEIARAVLADTPAGTKGEALTFTRATASSCALDANESEVTTLPAGRPCVTRNGLQVFRAGTNLVLRSEEFENIAWLDANIPAATRFVNDTVAPTGAVDAEKLEDTSGVLQQGVFQEVVATAQTKYTFSVWLKAGTRNEALISMSGVGNADGNITFSPTTGISSSEWRRYTFTTGTYGLGLTSISLTIQVGDTGSDQGTLYLWGAQLESGEYASPYVATTSAATTRNADVATFVLPDAAFASYAATVVGPPVGAAANARALFWIDGPDYFDLFKGASDRAEVDLNMGGNRSHGGAGTVWTNAQSNRVAGFITNTTTVGSCAPSSATCTTSTVAAFTTAITSSTAIYLCQYSSAGYAADSICSDFCADTSATRCR